MHIEKHPAAGVDFGGRMLFKGAVNEIGFYKKTLKEGINKVFELQVH